MVIRRDMAAAAVLAGIFLAGPGVADGGGDSSVVLLAHGVICDLRPDGSRAAPGTVSGVLNLVDQAREIDVVTQEVPAELGLSFGIRATLAEGAPAMQVDVVVTHPPMGAAGQTLETWDATLYPGEVALNVFSFEEDWERVEGPWRFQLRSGDKVLLDKSFVVTPPGTVPAVQATCHGAMILS